MVKIGWFYHLLPYTYVITYIVLLVHGIVVESYTSLIIPIRHT